MPLSQVEEDSAGKPQVSADGAADEQELEDLIFESRMLAGRVEEEED